jgi:antitoxin YefM
MEIITYTEARNNLAATMDRVLNDFTPIAVTRKNSKPIVMISLDEYNSLETTMYLMSSKKNRARLLEAIEDVENGKYEVKELIEE